MYYIGKIRYGLDRSEQFLKEETFSMVQAISGYQAYKRAQQEREDRKANGDQWVDHFVSFPKDDPSPIRLRFLYNIADETGAGHELLCYKMHDYFIPNGGKNGNGEFVRALCAGPFGKTCPLCEVADKEISRAKALPGGTKTEIQRKK